MANAKQLNLEVITPERQVLSETADAVVLPAHDGELGVLCDRAPLVCELGIGQLRFTRAGQTQRFFIDGGFAQVLDNHVTVLTKQALAGSEISAALVEHEERATADPASPRPARDQARQRARALLRTQRPR